MKITHFITHLFFAVVQGVVTSGTAEADAAKELKANVETFSEAQRRWSALLKESVEAKKAVGVAEESGEAKFSMRVDSEGRELSEAQQKYFEYSEVRNKEGLLIPVYHATDNSFTVFDREKLGAETDKNADDVAFAATAHIGFWFNSNDIKGKTAQNKSLAGYLNIEDPYYVDSIGALAAQIMDNYGEEYGELQERFDSRDYEAAEELGNSFVEWLERRGYDGIIVEDEEFGGTSYVALKSNQFKNADNQNPTENPDIRFSMRQKLDSFDSKEYNEVKLGKQEYARLSAAIGTYQPDAKGFVTQVLDNEKGEPAYIYTAFVDDGKLKVLYKKKAKYIDEKRTTYANGKSESFDKNAGEFRNKRNDSSGVLGIERKPNGRNDGNTGGNARGRDGRNGRGSNQDVSDSSEGSRKSLTVSDLGKIQYQLRIEDKNRLDILDRQEERYAADLKTLERAYAEAIRAEYERSIKPSEETSKRAAAAHRCKTVKIVL